MRRDVDDKIMQPGEIIVNNSEIVINEGLIATTLKVKNKGDRPIQVGSHFHFFEVNHALDFDREKAYGKRLDIPSGAAVRFEPGDEKTVQLVEYVGNRRIFGFRGEVNGPIDEARVYRAVPQENKAPEENSNKIEGYKQDPKENRDSEEKKKKIEDMRKNREKN